MEMYEYFVDECTGMACVVSTTHSFQDESDLHNYAKENGWELTLIEAPGYAYDENGELREDLLVW